MKLRHILTIILAVVSLAGAWFSYSRHNSLLEARAKLEAVQEQAQLQLERSEILRQFADAQEAAADSAVARAEAAERKLATAPTVRDSLASALDARDGYKVAYQSEKQAAAALRTSHDDLTEIVRRYGDASTAVIDASRPSFLDRVLPNVGAGAAVGVNPFTGGPSATVGVTLSWDF
jgi:hypothetical protein